MNGKSQGKYQWGGFWLPLGTNGKIQPVGWIFPKNRAPLSLSGAILGCPTFSLGTIFLFLPALSCPANSSYSLCTNLCSNSCAGLVDASRCPQKCTEGCRCDEGYTFDGNACIPKDKCGCFVEGIYYKVVTSQGWGIWGFLNFIWVLFFPPAWQPSASENLQRQWAYGTKHLAQKKKHKIFHLPSDSAPCYEEI